MRGLEIVGIRRFLTLTALALTVLLPCAACHTGEVGGGGGVETTESESGSKRFDRIVLLNHSGEKADNVQFELFGPGMTTPWPGIQHVVLGIVFPGKTKGRGFHPFGTEHPGVVRVVCKCEVLGAQIEATVDAAPGKELNAVTFWLLKRQPLAGQPGQPSYHLVGNGIYSGTVSTIHHSSTIPGE